MSSSTTLFAVKVGSFLEWGSIQFLRGVPFPGRDCAPDYCLAFPFGRGRPVENQVRRRDCFLGEVSPTTRRAACCFKHLSCASPYALAASRKSRYRGAGVLRPNGQRCEAFYAAKLCWCFLNFSRSSAVIFRTVGSPSGFLSGFLGRYRARLSVRFSYRCTIACDN